MTTLNVTLPESLQDFVQEQVARGGYRTPSEYLQSLVIDDQKRQAEAQLEAELLEGINSGEATEMTAGDWEDIRRELRERQAARRKG